GVTAPCAPPSLLPVVVPPRPTPTTSRSFPASTSVAALNRSGAGNGVPVPSSVTLKSCAHAADVTARLADKIAKRQVMPMSRLHACAGGASLSSNSLRRKGLAVRAVARPLLLHDQYRELRELHDAIGPAADHTLVQ